MADESETKDVCAWQTQHDGVSVPEQVELTQWAQLLSKLGLSEREALDAISQDGDVGRSIQRFVRNSCRRHFVPEDVLLAVAKAARK